MPHRLLLVVVCAATVLPAAELVREEGGKRYPVPIATPAEYLNPWPEAEEARFMDKAAHLIPLIAASGNQGGSTVNEREKELYPKAFFKILAGDVEQGVSMLEQPQQYDPKEHHAYTDGFDFWYGFTLKGQARKYFLFGHLLDDDYRKRYETAFAKWTATDPRSTPHPHYQKYNPKLQGWTPERFGNRQVDGRRTDNLYAMTTVTTYLFAEAAGNEEVRQVSWDRIRDYGVTMYMNGIGEWDSENYLGHTMSAYLNLYDFARDPRVKMHAKGMLDWISAAMAVKYWRGGWAGAVKRDYGNLMALDGLALKAAHLYFDDLGLECEGDRDDVYHITSAYRPPMAVVAMARGAFEPCELSISHPTYENWKEQDGRSGRDFPEFIETFQIGHHYRFGTLPFGNGGDVNGFKLISENSQRGVDYLVLGHNPGKDVDKGKPTTRSRMVTNDDGNSNVAHHRNLVIDLSDKGDAEFWLLCAPGAIGERKDGIQFLRHEKTWFALSPINLDWEGRHAKASEVFAQAGDVLYGKGKGGDYSGFALEIGEPETHGSYEDFVAAVVAESRLEGSGGTWIYTGVDGRSVGLEHRGGKLGLYVTEKDRPWILDRIRSAEEVFASYPVVTRDGQAVDWTQRFDQYRALTGESPITLGFKQGVLEVEAGGHRFVGTMQSDGTYTFSNE